MRDDDRVFEGKLVDERSSRVQDLDLLVKANMALEHIRSNHCSRFGECGADDCSFGEFPAVRVEQDIRSVAKVEIIASHWASRGREIAPLSRRAPESLAGGSLILYQNT